MYRQYISFKRAQCGIYKKAIAKMILIERDNLNTSNLLKFNHCSICFILRNNRSRASAIYLWSARYMNYVSFTSIPWHLGDFKFSEMPRNTEWITRANRANTEYINQNCIGPKRAEPGIPRFYLRSKEDHKFLLQGSRLIFWLDLLYAV